MDSTFREMPPLELELLRQSVDRLAAGSERCAHCQRTPLIGERIYVYGTGAIVCELCRAFEPAEPRATRVVHGPEFGHTMRITDRRAVA